MLRVITLALLAACSGSGDPKDPTDAPPTDAPPDDTGTPVVDADGDGSPAGDDCDDGDADAYPGAPELCDGVDQDCDGVADNGLVFETFYADDDQDGFGDAALPVETCDGAPAGRVADATDCDDSDGAIFPGAPEVCDGLDQDCDGAPDNGLVFERYYADTDQDGFGDEAFFADSCSGPPAGTVLDATDCDDSSDLAYPGAPEICDGLDQDCDGAPDNGLVFETWFTDADQDGYGDSDQSVQTCDGPPPGTVADATDCDDGDGNRSPGTAEVCDGLDQDCDEVPDNGVELAFAPDTDGDGWGQGTLTLACAAPVGLAPDGDCDDADVEVYPGSTAWRCDGVDTDCDGALEEVITPTDGDLDTLLAATVDGDIVCLEDGVHAETNTIVNRSILLGAMPGADPVLDAGGVGQGLLINGDATVRDLSITGGAFFLSGSGIQIVGDVVLEDVEVYDNHCVGTCRGAGISVESQGTLEMTGGVIRDNSITTAGQVVIEGAGIATRGQTTLTDVTIEDNVMSGPAFSRGAGLYALSIDLTLTDVRVYGNQVLGSFSPNGAGLSFNSVDAVMDRVDIRDNYAQASGGIFGTGLSQSFGTVTMNNVIAAGNAADSAFNEGVGIECSAGTLIATNVTAFGNASIAPFTSGSGIGSPGCTTTLNNVLVQDNLGGGVAAGAGTSTVTYSNVFGHVEDYQVLASQTGLNGNISVDSLIVSQPSDDPTTWDLHLQATSPLIDAGDPAITDFDGSPSDIGAYGGPGGDW